MAKKEKQIHVKVTPELHDEFLQSVAINKDDDMSTVIRGLIKQYVKETAKSEKTDSAAKTTT